MTVRISLFKSYGQGPGVRCKRVNRSTQLPRMCAAQVVQEGTETFCREGEGLKRGQPNTGT
eukprot:4625934-Pyramimonas_sp.AAC.2